MGLHPLDHFIHARVGIAPVIPDAIALRAIAGRDQGLEGIKRIQSRHAPAQQIDGSIIALDLGKERRQRHGIQLCPHTNPRPHGHNRLANLLIIDVAIIRAIQRDFKAIGEAGFRQQSPRARRIIRQAHIFFLHIAIHLGREESARHHGLAAHGGAVDRLDVNRVIKRLAHAQILHRIAPLHIGIEQFITEHIHRQEDGAHFRAFQHADILRLAQPVQILQGRVEHEINFA